MSENTDSQARATSKPQDLRRDLHTQLETVNNSIDELHRSLDDLINETNSRIDELHRSLSEQLRALQKSMDTYFLWMMGMLVTMTGVLIAVIKL